MPALESNSLIVVTGITGYIASHVGLSALQAGHRVRGTIRSLSKAEALKAAYAKQGVDISSNKLEFVILDDLTSEERYKAAFAIADGVVHVALPAFETPNLVEATTDSVMSALKAAAAVPTIKRFVLTSSAVAAYSPGFSVVDHVLTGEDWNMDGVKLHENPPEMFKSGPMSLWLSYAAAKTLSELAARKWLDEEKPAFDLVSIMPFTAFGPVLCGVPPSSAAWPVGLMKNDITIPSLLPPQWFVDVRDAGRLHTLALTTPSAGRQRIWAAAEPFGWNQVLSIMRRHFPDVELPKDIPTGVPSVDKINSEFGRKMLGGEWVPLEQSILDTVRSVGY